MEKPRTLEICVYDEFVVGDFTPRDLSPLTFTAPAPIRVAIPSMYAASPMLFARPPNTLSYHVPFTFSRCLSW